MATGGGLVRGSLVKALCKWESGMEARMFIGKHRLDLQRRDGFWFLVREGRSLGTKKEKNSERFFWL